MSSYGNPFICIITTWLTLSKRSFIVEFQHRVPWEFMEIHMFIVPLYFTPNELMAFSYCGRWSGRLPKEVVPEPNIHHCPCFSAYHFTTLLRQLVKTFNRSSTVQPKCCVFCTFQVLLCFAPNRTIRRVLLTSVKTRTRVSALITVSQQQQPVRRRLCFGTYKMKCLFLFSILVTGSFCRLCGRCDILQTSVSGNAV